MGDNGLGGRIGYPGSPGTPGAQGRMVVYNICISNIHKTY